MAKEKDPKVRRRYEQQIQREFLRISKAQPWMELAWQAVNMGFTEQEFVAILRPVMTREAIPEPHLVSAQNAYRDAQLALERKNGKTAPG